MVDRQAAERNEGRGQCALRRRAGVQPGRLGDEQPRLLLAEWRQAERAMEAETPGTTAWEAARAAVDRLRSEYRRAFTERGQRD